jgi:hypothetical protein
VCERERERGERGGREEGERRERGGREEGERRERGGRENRLAMLIHVLSDYWSAKTYTYKLVIEPHCRAFKGLLNCSSPQRCRPLSATYPTHRYKYPPIPREHIPHGELDDL